MWEQICYNSRADTRRMNGAAGSKGTQNEEKKTGNRSASKGTRNGVK